MSIQYALYPNHLTDNPNDHLAMVQNQTPHTMDDLIDIITDSGSTVTRADILSSIEGYQAAIRRVLTDGGSIKTPLMRISASISGVFIGWNDYFDPSRHAVHLNIHPGPQIKEIVEKLSAEKIDTIKPRPVIEAFRDTTLDVINAGITPGGPGEIIGNLLKVDPEDGEQGIFFIAPDNTEIKVEMLVRNKPRNLIFMIPELVSGEYMVEVRAKMKDNKHIQSGRLHTAVIAG